MDEAVAILLIILGMRGHPIGIGSRMVWHPVKPHLHIERMGSGDKSLQVGNSAIGRVGLLEVGGSIRAVDSSTPRIDWHEPNNIDTQSFQFAELLPGGIKRACLRKRANVHFVYYLMACFILGC